jgi:hypothetical protein
MDHPEPIEKKCSTDRRDRIGSMAAKNKTKIYDREVYTTALTVFANEEYPSDVAALPIDIK